MPAYTSLDSLLDNYNSSYPEEFVFIKEFRDLLRHPDAYQRHHLPGHITGSTWVVNPDRSKVLLLHHGKLNTWLQPGGHADGDHDILGVAMRELEEESGIKSARNLSMGIFDLDIHPIPKRKDFPEHLHYDVRFCLEALESEKILVSEESLDVRWIEFDTISDFTDNRSIIRMVEKTKTLPASTF